MLQDSQHRSGQILVTALQTTKATGMGNQSAWPARGLENARLHYFFTLDSANISDVTTSASYNECNNTPSCVAMQYSGDICVVEIDCTDTVIYPGGEKKYHRKVDLRIATDDSTWNSDNDWSYDGRSTDPQNPASTSKIVVYDGDRIVWGQEP